MRELNEQAGVCKSGVRRSGVRKGIGYSGGAQGDGGPAIAASSGTASRFFPAFYYCAKAPPRERHAGCGRNPGKCVKPLALLRWLVRLGGVRGGLALVPYAGTGSEVLALLQEGMYAIGIERDATMAQTAEARIAHWQKSEVD